jgi:hypothetical protein
MPAWGSTGSPASYPSGEGLSLRAPSLRAAAKIGPYFVAGFDFGTTKAFSLRLVWPDFRLQRHPPG